MERSFRKYFKAAFYELLIIFLYLLIKMRPVSEGDGVGFTLKQGSVLFSLLALLIILGCATYVIIPRHPQFSVRVISFLQHKPSWGWALIAGCSAFIIVGLILITLHIAGMIRIFGGLYTLAIFPAAILICIQTLSFVGETFEVRLITSVSRRVTQSWQAGVRYSTVFITFLSRHNLTKAPQAQILENILYVSIPLWVFSRLFHGPLNLPFGLEALDFRYGYAEVLGYVILVFLLAYLLPGWIGKLVGLVFVLYLFALPLSGLWEYAYNESNIVRGLLPWNDANGYYQDASRLLDGALISQFSAKRPLFSGLLSFLLWVSGRNLQASLVILAAINALACYIAAREVQRTHGIFAAVLMSSIVFFFYRRFSGSTLTEPLGLGLGLSGFALLWRGGSTLQGRLICAGLFLASLSLMARSGALFTLISLVLWAGWLFRQNKTLSLPWLGYAITAVLAGFAVNYLILRLIGIPGAMSNFNFSYTFYGMVSGGESWNYVAEQHPELTSMVEPETSRRIFELAFDRLRENPGGIFQAAYKAFAVFLQPNIGLFSFIRSGYSETFLVFTHYLLLIFSALGMFLFFIRRNCVHLALASLSGIGILLSVPFAPPWDADYMRVYAASVPFIAALPAIALISLISPLEKYIKPIHIISRSQDVIPSSLSLSISFILVGMMIIGSLGVRLLSHPPQLMDGSCPDGEEGVYLRSIPGSNLYIWADKKLSQTWVPNVRYGSFIGGHNLDFPFPEILAEFAAVEPDTIVISGNDLKSGAGLVVFGDRRQIPQRNSVLQACGNWSDSPVPRQFGFFYATSFEEVPVQ